MTFALYFAPIVVWVLWHLFTDKEFHYLEAIAVIALSAAIAYVVPKISTMISLYDEGIIIGNVTDIYEKKYSCNTSWSFATSIGCENYDTQQVKTGESCSTINNIRSCTPIYQTQYRYHYEWEKSYFVKADVGEVEIKREDDRGAYQPLRWRQAYVGEPFAATYSFQNYVRSAKSSLFNRDTKVIENYKPNKIFDYYKYSGFIGTTGDYELLMKQSSIAGVNILVYSGDASMEDLWKTLAGGKIYDMIISLKEPEVRSWSKDDIVDVKVRDMIILDKDNWVKNIGTLIKKYYVKPEKDDFKYLEKEIGIPWYVHVILSMLLVVIVVFLTKIFKENDLRKT